MMAQDEKRWPRRLGGKGHRASRRNTLAEPRPTNGDCGNLWLCITTFYYSFAAFGQGRVSGSVLRAAFQGQVFRAAFQGQV